MKKSPHEIVRRTCGRGTGSNLFGGAGDDILEAAGSGNYLDGWARAANDALFGGAGKAANDFEWRMRA